MTDAIIAPKRALLEAYIATADEDWARAEIATLALLGSIRHHRAQERGQAAEPREAVGDD